MRGAWSVCHFRTKGKGCLLYTFARYSGWGGIPQAFDERNDKWEKEYFELKTLLTPEEYAAARSSTLNAHYTSPTVIRAMYAALEHMGVKPNTVLEPAMGIGNFFGLLPEQYHSAKLYGVELDSATGKMCIRDRCRNQAGGQRRKRSSPH